MTIQYPNRMDAIEEGTNRLWDLGVPMDFVTQRAFDICNGKVVVVRSRPGKRPWVRCVNSDAKLAMVNRAMGL